MLRSFPGASRVARTPQHHSSPPARSCQQSFLRGWRWLARTQERDRLVPLVEIKQAAQGLAARAVELRIVLHDSQRLVARLGNQLGMDLRARDAIAGQSALPDPEHVAFAAQLQIFLSDPKSIGRLADGAQPRLRHLAK